MHSNRLTLGLKAGPAFVQRILGRFEHKNTALLGRSNSVMISQMYQQSVLACERNDAVVARKGLLPRVLQ